MYGISYMWNLKRNDRNELTKQKETDLERMNLRLLVGMMEERIVREFGMDMYTLLYFK